MEFLFSQRGCKNQPGFFPYFSTTLNYVEVPVQWHYGDWLVEGSGRKSDWYRVTLNTGFVYSRLMGYKDKFPEFGTGISAALPDLKKNGVCFALGASFYASRHFGFTFRYNRALNFLYKPGAGRNYRNSLYEHFLAFQVNYRL